MMVVGGVRNEAAGTHDVVRAFPMRLRWACALEPHLRTRWAASFPPPALHSSLPETVSAAPFDGGGLGTLTPRNERSRRGTHLLEIRLGKFRLIRLPLGGYGEESGRALVIEQLRREKR